MTKKNPLWKFLSSVQLALTTLLVLAATSILGTLIKQGQVPAYYVQEYGESLARLLQILDLPMMYSSWWFISFLMLFAINLLVCSIERLPAIWHIVMLDNLAIDQARLEKKPTNHQLQTSLPAAASADCISEHLMVSGWGKPRRRENDEEILLFAQKKAWSRFGVYIVHLSILVIFTGAIIGKVYGFKAYVFLPEGRSTSTVFLQGTAEPVPLNFELYCDRFDPMSFSNGRIWGERSHLTVNDPRLEAPYQKSIVVNDPLTYRGITFFKADSHPLEEYFVVIHNQASGEEQAFRVPAKRDVNWPGKTVSFRIDELQVDDEDLVQQAKLLFFEEIDSEPVEVWVGDRKTVIIGETAEEFSISFRQLHTSLLLATKDPGTWIFYLGCIMMLIGLAVSFLLSHWQLWVRIVPSEKCGSRILICGSSNKLKPAFEDRLRALVKSIEQDSSLTLPTNKEDKKKRQKANQ
jgi:cytochrome c biogenesis protein